MEQIIQVGGAFDKRDPDPSKNYGIHCMEIRFVLKDERGAVQFLVYTGMHLPDVSRELWARGGKWNPFEPKGADLGYHSPTAQYEDQTPMDCDLLPGGRCYYDGSGLQADEFMPDFLSGGSDAVFKMLRNRHAELFGPAPHDDRSE